MEIHNPCAYESVKFSALPAKAISTFDLIIIQCLQTPVLDKKAEVTHFETQLILKHAKCLISLNFTMNKTIINKLSKGQTNSKKWSQDSNSNPCPIPGVLFFPLYQTAIKE